MATETLEDDLFQDSPTTKQQRFFSASPKLNSIKSNPESSRNIVDIFSSDLIDKKKRLFSQMDR